MAGQQQTWDRAIGQLGLTDEELDFSMDPRIAAESWAQVGRELEAAGALAAAAEAWDWTLSQTLESIPADDPLASRLVWEAASFYERTGALSAARDLLEEAWAAIPADHPVAAGFAVRMLDRLADVYSRLRLGTQARATRERADAIAELSGARLRDCA